MQLSVTVANPQDAKADLLVLVVDKGGDLFETAHPDLVATVKELKEGIEAKRIKRELVLRAPAGVGARYVAFTSTELVRNLSREEALRALGGHAARLGRDMNLATVAFAASGRDPVRAAALLVEGAALAAYSFEKYRKQKRGYQDEVTLLVVLAPRRKDKKAEVSNACHDALATCETINRCRDLVNEPGGVVFPETMAQAARDIATRSGLQCEVWEEEKLREEGYNGLLQVGAGSHPRPPRLIVLRYRPRRGKASKSGAHLALVGKGLTFDTGGISIKPAANMWMMKGDMAGGAACLYAMEVIARLKPAIPVTAIVPSSENFPGPDAQRPGDIFIAKNGKSIHVDNTDAEGRLILTDGLFHAGREGATHIVDVATLTGSCVRALGTSIAGIMGTDRKLVNSVIGTGKEQGENFWELPLHEEYRELIDFPIADVNNVGGANAGAITAGLFLKEFVPEKAAWCHLDIAGTFIAEKPWKHYGPGATGFAVKTLARLALAFA
ncbi:MAG: leucyl aminopeptidase [Acidobacteriota bacterium]